jgi:hypothetical protein
VLKRGVLLQDLPPQRGTGPYRSIAETLRRRREALMNHSSKAIEIEDVEARVAELERTAEASKLDR